MVRLRSQQSPVRRQPHTQHRGVAAPAGTETADGRGAGTALLGADVSEERATSEEADTAGTPAWEAAGAAGTPAVRTAEAARTSENETTGAAGTPAVGAAGAAGKLAVGTAGAAGKPAVRADGGAGKLAVGATEAAGTSANEKVMAPGTPAAGATGAAETSPSKAARAAAKSAVGVAEVELAAETAEAALEPVALTRVPTIRPPRAKFIGEAPPTIIAGGLGRSLRFFMLS